MARHTGSAWDSVAAFEDLDEMYYGRIICGRKHCHGNGQPEAQPNRITSEIGAPTPELAKLQAIYEAKRAGWLQRATSLSCPRCVACINARRVRRGRPPHRAARTIDIAASYAYNQWRESRTHRSDRHRCHDQP